MIYSLNDTNCFREHVAEWLSPELEIITFGVQFPVLVTFRSIE